MYETGVTVAFLLWLYGCISTVVRKNSLLEKNLNRIGKKTSLLGSDIVDVRYPKDSASKSMLKYVAVMGVSLILIVFSWLYVAVSLFAIFYSFRKDLGVPLVIKEYRWKLRNVDMSFDEIIKAIVQLEGLDESEYPRVRQEWIDHINRFKP
ncbi:MAG: hypothetical protein WBB40_05265 [Psychrobacter alimentarius]